MTTCVGVVFANIGTFDFSSLTSGFLRKTLGHPPSPGHPRINFFYGYGWSGLNQEWGYGYGYNGSYAVVHGAGVADYGFEGDNGTASVDDISVTQTTATITYSTPYLARAVMPWSTIQNPTDPSEFTLAGIESGFNSGERVITLTDLLCNTQYYFAVVTHDAANNTWVTDTQPFTTSSCNDNHVTITGSTYSPTNTSQTTSHNPRSLRLPPITLALGSVGVDVQDLQILLNFFGTFLASNGAGSPGNETMTFGEKTKAALMKFQSTFGLGADGIYGQKTHDVMESFLE